MPANDSSSRTYSVIMEMENCRTICWAELREVVMVLAEQIGDHVRAGGKRPEVILAHPGPESESADLMAAIFEEVPQLGEVACVSAVGVPEGRYYELKNAGISKAAGELILFLDSDTLVEPQWLATLLNALENPEVIAASGHTYLNYNDLISRMLALAWVFPLRDRDGKASKKRALNVNNCGFQADWIRVHPFPIDNGFKVSCTKLMKVMEAASIQFARAPAYAKHAPLTGWRFLVWRALVTGRDADRKCEDLKSRSKLRRFRAAVQFCLKMERRTITRIFGKYRQVALKAYQVPLVLLLGCLFYLLAFIGQLGRLLGLVADIPETVPAYAEHH